MKATHAMIFYKTWGPNIDVVPGQLVDIKDSDFQMKDNREIGFSKNIAYRVRVREKPIWDHGEMYHTYPYRWSKDGQCAALVHKLPELPRMGDYDNAAREAAQKCGDNYHG